MTFEQIITPTPDIPCKPGWCLQYVRQAFGLPARYGSATEAWEKSPTQHRDRDFPPGLWVPVWYGLVDEPLGHVILRAPDGSCYSTSTLGSTPYHHPNLAHLEAFYAYYGMTLTYRGWTEDVAGYPVITYGGLAAQGTITETENDVGTVESITDKVALDIEGYVDSAIDNNQKIREIQQSVAFQEKFSVRMLEAIAAQQGVTVDSKAIAADIRAELAALIGGK